MHVIADIGGGQGTLLAAILRRHAHLLANVLHGWDDRQAARILQACRRAMRPTPEPFTGERQPRREVQAFAAGMGKSGSYPG
jgi:hypothetical protein